jgi:cytochrome oxidase assembly protein ShyY1
MYRFLLKPKWLVFTLVVIAAVVTMINLSLWQLDRLGERRAFNDLVNDRSLTPATAPEPGWLGPDGDVDAAEWRVVEVSGTFDGQTDALPVSGGYQLLSPITLADGSSVLVNRGGIDVTADIVPPPVGSVDLTARIRRLPTSLSRQGLTGTYLEAISSAPADANVTPLPLPTLDEGSHLSYTIQWLVFAVCVAIGWVLAVRRSATPKIVSAKKPSKHQAIPWRDELP